MLRPLKPDSAAFGALMSAHFGRPVKFILPSNLVHRCTKIDLLFEQNFAEICTWGVNNFHPPGGISAYGLSTFWSLAAARDPLHVPTRGRGPPVNVRAGGPECLGACWLVCKQRLRRPRVCAKHSAIWGFSLKSENFLIRRALGLRLIQRCGSALRF